MMATMIIGMVLARVRKAAMTRAQPG